MARLSLNKSSLTKQSRQLQTFERFLPALDLKRKQLMAERAKALAEQQATAGEIATLHAAARQGLPMLANRDIPLDGLVTLRAVQVGEENRMGTRLPRFDGVELSLRPYGLMTRPHWVDRLVELLSRMLELQARANIEAQRVARLDEAVRKVTQRVNLFEKVLIPRTRANIKRIRVALTDAERAAVVRSKIAKGKRQREGLA